MVKNRRSVSDLRSNRNGRKTGTNGFIDETPGRVICRTPTVLLGVRIGLAFEHRTPFFDQNPSQNVRESTDPGVPRKLEVPANRRHNREHNREESCRSVRFAAGRPAGHPACRPAGRPAAQTLARPSRCPRSPFNPSPRMQKGRAGFSRTPLTSKSVFLGMPYSAGPPYSNRTMAPGRLMRRATVSRMRKQWFRSFCSR